MNGLPRILIFIDWYLPGFKAGGPISSCVNLVNHLKQEYQFYIITRDTDYTSDLPYASVISDSWNEVDGTQVYYLSEKSLNSRNIWALIKEVDPDLVYVNGIYSFYFSILPVIFSKLLGYRNILVAGRGMLAPSAIQVKGIKKKLFFKLARRFNFYKGITFHATNTREEADIQAVLGNNVNIRVAPNLPEFTDGRELKKAYQTKVSGELKLVSIARIAPEKNTRFALEVLKSYEGEPHITFDLYGPIYSEAYWQECEVLIAQLPETIAVTYKGSLEKSLVHPTLQQYHALFMPTKGENFGHIILECFTAGCPVLISDQTPWMNLYENALGYDLPLTDKTAYHTALTDLVLMSQEEYDLLADSAYKFAAAYIQNRKHVDANKALFKFPSAKAGGNS